MAKSLLLVSAPIFIGLQIKKNYLHSFWDFRDKLVSAVSLNTIRVMFKILWWISASAGSTGFLIVSVTIINACEFTWSSHVLISWYKIRQFTIRLTWPIFTRHYRPTYRSRLKMHEWIETVHSSATLQMAQIRQRCKTKEEKETQMNW